MQGLSIQPLGEDDCIRPVFGEVALNDRCRTGRSINDNAAYSHDARAIIARCKQEGRSGDYLRGFHRQSSMRRCRNRETLPAVSGPIKLEVIWGAIPGVLAATAPHCGSFSANDARFVDEGNSVHCKVRDGGGYDEVRRSSENSALRKGCLYAFFSGHEKDSDGRTGVTDVSNLRQTLIPRGPAPSLFHFSKPILRLPYIASNGKNSSISQNPW